MRNLIMILPAQPVPMSANTTAVFPAALARVLGRLPVLPASIAFSGALNRLAWPSLKDLDWDALKGRRFCVHVKDAGVKTYFSVTAQGFAPQVTARAEVTFTATARDFLRLALRQEDPDTLFFNRHLLIEGNTDLGLTVKNMLDGVALEDILAAMPGPIRSLVQRLQD